MGARMEIALKARSAKVRLQYKRDMKSKTLDVAFGSLQVLHRNLI